MNFLFSLGIDLGSSSVKVSLLDLNTGARASSVTWPESEMPIISKHAGWAEQDPNLWWQNTKIAIQKLFHDSKLNPSLVQSIGIAYQMHGLVCIDQDLQAVNLSNIWCDSRAHNIGDSALKLLGEDYCFRHLKNSPGNFTGSKLKWLQQNEPETFKRVFKILLPGDFLAMKLSGKVTTTKAGLSEGILWDYLIEEPAWELLKQ